MTTVSNDFRPDIEGMRAIAVLLVVAFHYELGLPGGFIGVDIFFVVSGYLITGILLRELQQTGALDLVQFYGRRARRLLPALLVVSVATLVAAAFVLSPVERGDVAKAGFAASAYMSNFWFMTRAFDYFAPESDANPFLHTWSLSVEEQFYFIWPALMLLTSRLKRSQVLTVLTIVTAISFVACMALVGWQQPWAFYSPFTRAWEFGLGAVAVIFFRGSQLRAPGAIAAAGLIAIAASVFVIDETSVFPSWSSVVPVLGTVAVLAAGQQRNMVSALLSNPAQVWIGKVSYSLYLWHWPVIVLATIAWPDLSMVGRAVCLFVGVAGAVASYYFVEQPIRFSSWLTLAPRRSVYLGATITVAGMITGGAGWAWAKHAGSSPFQRSAQAAASQAPAVTVDSRRCISELLQTTAVGCDYLPGNTGGTLVLLGDSHAAQWFTPVLEYARSKNLRLVAFLKSSCAVTDVPVYSLRLRREFSECATWRRDALAKALELKPSLVVVSQHAYSYVRREGADPTRTQINDVQAWAAGIGRTVSALGAQGASIAVIADTPLMRVHVPTCLSRGGETTRRRAERCSRSEQQAVDRLLLAAEEKAVRAAGGTYVDMTRFFCRANRCPSIAEGVILYHDTNHISEKYAGRLTKQISDELMSSASPRRLAP